MDNSVVAEFGVTPNVTLAAVNKLIDQVWSELTKESDFQVKHPDMAAKLNPYVLRRPGSQFGVGEAILVAVAGGLVKDAAVGIWQVFIWPALKQKFGKDVIETK